MKRLITWWNRMWLEYYRRQAGRAALALLLAPGGERLKVRQYFDGMLAKLTRLERP